MKISKTFHHECAVEMAKTNKGKVDCNNAKTYMKKTNSGVLLDQGLSMASFCKDDSNRRLEEVNIVQQFKAF